MGRDREYDTVNPQGLDLQERVIEINRVAKVVKGGRRLLFKGLGGGVRAVLELAGIRDVLSKSIGTQNPINLVKATMDGLIQLRRPEEVAKLRGLSVNQVLGLDKLAEAKNLEADET